MPLYRLQDALLIYIIISCALLHTVEPQQELEELCSNPVISYTPTQSHFLNSVDTTLSCNRPTPVQWWTSSDPCGSFSESTLCNGTANTCRFNITHIKDQFYHCCTTGGRVEDNIDSAICFHVQICTDLENNTNASPPVGFYGETLLIYEKLYARPPPNRTVEIYLGSSIITDTQLTVFQLDRNVPLLIFEYRIPIPSNMGRNPFFGRFAYDSVCDNRMTVVHNVPLIERPTSDDSSTTEFTTPQSTGGLSSSLEECKAVRTGLGAGLAVIAVILVVVVVVVTIVVMSRMYAHRRKANGRTDSPPSQVPPPRYNQLSPMYSSSSSTIGLNQRNGIYNDTSPPPLPPHSNNSTPNQLSPRTFPPPSSLPPPATNTPVTPTNLQIAQGVTPTHTGNTPLIAFTPGDNSRTLSQGETINPQYDEIHTRVDGSITMTTMNGGGEAREGSRVMAAERSYRGNDGLDNGSTLYNEPFIGNLASNVQLHGNNNSASNV